MKRDSQSLVELMEKADFIDKVFALLELSRRYIDRLLKIALDLSKFSASVAHLFLPFSKVAVEATVRIVSFVKKIGELSLTRFSHLPNFDLWLRGLAPSEEGYFPMEMGRANVSFMLDVAGAKKTATELTRRIVAKTPKPVILPRLTPLPGTRLMEETIEEPSEEHAKTVSHIVADLQGLFESNLAPKIKSMKSVIQQFGNHLFLLPPSAAASKAFISSPAELATLPYHTPVSREEEAPQFKQHGIPIHKQALSSVEASYRYRRASIFPKMYLGQMGHLLEEICPSLNSWILGMRPILRSTVQSFSAMPAVASTAEGVIAKTLSKSVPGFKTHVTSDGTRMVPPDQASKSETSVARTGVEAFKLPEIAASHLVSLNRKYPLLLSEPTISETWRASYELMRSAPEKIETLGVKQFAKSVSEEDALGRGRASILDVISTQTAMLEMMSTTLKRLSKLERSCEIISESYERTSEEGVLGPDRVQKLDTISWTSTIVDAVSTIMAEVQRWYQIRKETTVEAGRASVLDVISMQTRMRDMMSEVKRSSSIGLETLRLTTTLASLMKEMASMRKLQAARYGEGLGAVGPPRTTMLGALDAAAPDLLSTLESYVSGIPSAPPPTTRLEPARPTIKNTFNITISSEAEEDLRDLERKISRILSEQIRRYYGSRRI